MNNYYWFGIRNAGGNSRTRNAFKPVFKSINEGMSNPNADVRTSESWSESKAHLIASESRDAALTSKIQMAVVLTTMLGLIITLI